MGPVLYRVVVQILDYFGFFWRLARTSRWNDVHEHTPPRGGHLINCRLFKVLNQHGTTGTDIDSIR